jgi:hypothetical protein
MMREYEMVSAVWAEAMTAKRQIAAAARERRMDGFRGGEYEGA